MKKSILLMIALAGTMFCNAQNPQWINYTSSTEITAIIEEGDSILAGTSGGLACISKATGNSTYFNQCNSGLYDSRISSISIDMNGNRWFGYSWNFGISKFDGSNWTYYGPLNSPMPGSVVYALLNDNAGNTWIGTESCLLKFDGTNWTIYNENNSGLPNREWPGKI